MRAPWKKQPEPPTVAQRLSDHRRQIAIVGAASAVALGSTLYRKRKGSSKPLNAAVEETSVAPVPTVPPVGPL